MGGDAEELYDALADVCCARVVEHFTGREWYSVRTLTEVARGIGDLLDRVPDLAEEDRRFAERYARGLRVSLDKAEVTELFTVDAVVSDLGDLSSLTNLTSLHIREASVSDLRPLSRLTLTALMLRRAPVSDVTPLARLTGLDFLLAKRRG